MSFFCSKYLDTTVTDDEYYEETTEYGGTFVDNVRKAVIVGEEYIDEIISNGYVQFLVNNWWKIILVNISVYIMYKVPYNIFLQILFLKLYREDDEIEHLTDDEMTEKMQINELGAIFDSKTGKRRYDNYQILRVNPDTDEHLDVLQFLEKGNICTCMI